VARPMEGIRIVEVANWTFVPSAGAILADLGADVIKVEPPTGDPQRALQNLLNFDTAGPNPFLEIPNRGKRSITLDLSSPAGREALLRVCRIADVFLTSALPSVRTKLGIDIDDVRSVNPRIIYVRGTGWGTSGPMADTGGYDLASAWASCGLADRLTPDNGEPPPQPPAFFDLQGGVALAGAIAIALLQRERTGKPSVVDVSLMNVAMWTQSPDLVSAPYVATHQRMNRLDPGNPLVNWYRASDGRWLYLVCLQADRFWVELCRIIGAPQLADDPRFVDARRRYENRDECVRALDRVFATRTLDEWRSILTNFSGVWAPVLTYREVHAHPQVEPNGYLPEVEREDGTRFRLVAPPMKFDDVPTSPTGPAPGAGEHNEAVLRDAGLGTDEIADLALRGAFG
jgi:crotonobetainyl-CoA:carnitine CoA-transferase CaiB-like acyl-CoA transferase